MQTIPWGERKLSDSPLKQGCTIYGPGDVIKNKGNASLYTYKIFAISSVNAEHYSGFFNMRR